MRKKRMHWLAEVVNDQSFKIGAEIGAATGLTTKYILDNCPFLKQLFVVDTWHPVVLPGHPSYYERHPWSLNNMKEIFKEKIKGDERVTVLEGLSWEMSTFVSNGSLDFAFIDASHDLESVLKDLTAWIPKVRVNGMICGHDINSPGVKQAVEEKFGKKYHKPGIDQVWCIRL